MRNSSAVTSQKIPCRIKNACNHQAWLQRQTQTSRKFNQTLLFLARTIAKIWQRGRSVASVFLIPMSFLSNCLAAWPMDNNLEVARPSFDNCSPVRFLRVARFFVCFVTPRLFSLLPFFLSLPLAVFIGGLIVEIRVVS